MGSAGLRPSVAVAALLRQKRKDMGLTLRQVSERIERQGEPLPTSTLARIEHGKLDPGVRRLHLLLRLYSVPPHLVSDLVELETLAVAHPAPDDLEKLYRDGVEHWKQGNIGDGLAHLFAVRQYVPTDEASRLLRQRATLAFAITARNLGKFRLAKQIVEDLLCEPADPSLRVQVLTLASSLWRGLGSIDTALALARRARELLSSGDTRDQAWVLHQEAKLLLDLGQTQEAGRCLRRALTAYRKANDTYGEVRARILQTRLFEADGKLRQAFESCKRVIALAEGSDHAGLVLVARLDLGRVLVRRNEFDEAARILNECLGKAILLGDRHGEFLAHYYLWKANEELGDPRRAQLELDAASYLVQFIDEQSVEADEVRHLQE